MVGPFQGQPKAATSQGPNTCLRNTQSQDLDRLSREDQIKAAKSNLTSPKQARDLLEWHSYLPKGEAPSRSSLSITLLLLAQAATGKLLTDGIKAVAVLLEDEMVDRIAGEISSYVLDKISPLLDRSDKATDSLNEASSEIREAADRIKKTCEETRGVIQKAGEHRNFSPVFAEPRNPHPGFPAPALSYAAALSSQLPLSHPHTLACSCTRDRQTLIDKDPFSANNGLEALTEKELVAKANEAIELMKAQSDDDGVDATVLGAKRIGNGGIVYELNSDQAAKWVRHERDAFEKNFGGSSIIKDRISAVIIKNVPVSHSPDALSECRKIKRDSNLKLGSLISTRWIKPIQCHSSNQQTAHLIAKFNSPKAANISI